MARADDETTPLLSGGSGGGNGGGERQRRGSLANAGTAVAKSAFSAANRILLAGFLMSFTLGITQVPIVYVFRLMECDIFYTHHPPYDGPAGMRCHRRDIDANTALQFSILGMTTSLSGVFNLFVCGYFIKRWGPRWAFVSQTSLLGVRVSTQVIGVTLGGRAGEIVFQTCQCIGVIGGPRGYLLVLNTAVAEVVAAKDRTAVFGRLQGAVMLGTAFGYLLGGVLGDVYGIRRPFEVAFFLYLVSTIYGGLFLPDSVSTAESDKKQSKGGLEGFFAPIKVIRSHRYRLGSGKVIKNYGLIFLALGIFLGVFASGYAPLLLQLYATSEFNFNTTQNGYLMFGISSIRGLFLLLIFPKIISKGRSWFNAPPEPQHTTSHEVDHDTLPTSPGEFTTTEAGLEVAQEPVQAPEPDEEDSGTGFDLLFVRWSLAVDSLVTLFAAFSSKAWHVYLAGFLLPFASGSAPAAKGVMTELCPPYQRQDAISGITLVEASATMLTQGVFGLIFAAFSSMGKPSLTFFCNAGCAAFASAVLFLARLPPANSERIDDDNGDEDLLHNETHDGNAD
ncbi:major facilitator superfamily transporter [Xylariaceae sp. FL1019]|nr:major facilitator superfamily transporter [Xylariaceae sp. FL1019]